MRLEKEVRIPASPLCPKTSHTDPFEDTLDVLGPVVGGVRIIVCGTMQRNMWNMHVVHLQFPTLYFANLFFSNKRDSRRYIRIFKE